MYRAVRIVIVLLQSLIEDALRCAIQLKQKLKELISYNNEFHYVESVKLLIYFDFPI